MKSLLTDSHASEEIFEKLKAYEDDCVDITLIYALESNTNPRVPSESTQSLSLSIQHLIGSKLWCAMLNQS